MADEQVRPIIIKRIKKVSGGAHGGAWKVAYADFVTAMMAFFMLLWLLNVTTEEQKLGLAEYFVPTVASTSSDSGSADILGGTSAQSDGAQSSSITVSIPSAPSQSGEGGEADANKAAEEKSYEEMIARREQDYFEKMAAEMRTSIQESPELVDLQDQVLIDVTDEGLRIQLVDKDNRAMFKTATATLYKYAEKMIIKVSEVVQKMPNRVSITGHTDAKPFNPSPDYSNWELSSDRAHTSRRVLSRAGVSPDRFAEVLGKASTEPLLPDRPYRSENRRITILLLREAPTLPSNLM